MRDNQITITKRIDTKIGITRLNIKLLDILTMKEEVKGSRGITGKMCIKIVMTDTNKESEILDMNTKIMNTRERRIIQMIIIQNLMGIIMTKTEYKAMLGKTKDDYYIK